MLFIRGPSVCGLPLVNGEVLPLQRCPQDTRQDEFEHVQRRVEGRRCVDVERVSSYDKARSPKKIQLLSRLLVVFNF